MSNYLSHLTESFLFSEAKRYDVKGKRVGTEYVLHAKPLKVESDRVFLPLYMSICL